jgi:hypothetical protein
MHDGRRPAAGMSAAVSIIHPVVADRAGHLLDLDGDGAATIRDVLMLLWSSWCYPTLQQLASILEALEPRTLEFFEIEVVIQALGLADVFLWVRGADAARPGMIVVARATLR